MKGSSIALGLMIASVGVIVCCVKLLIIHGSPQLHAFGWFLVVLNVVLFGINSSIYVAWKRMRN